MGFFVVCLKVFVLFRVFLFLFVGFVFGVIFGLLGFDLFLVFGVCVFLV